MPRRVGEPVEDDDRVELLDAKQKDAGHREDAGDQEVAGVDDGGQLTLGVVFVALYGGCGEQGGLELKNIQFQEHPVPRTSFSWCSGL